MLLVRQKEFNFFEDDDPVGAQSVSPQLKEKIKKMKINELRNFITQNGGAPKGNKKSPLRTMALKMLEEKGSDHIVHC